MRYFLAAAFLLAACGKREDKSAKPAPASPPPAAAAEAPAPGSLFNIQFNDPAIPEAPDHTVAHPGGEDGPANRAGYTRGEIERRAGIRWESAVSGGRVSLYATSIDVGYKMNIGILVSANFKEDGCAYRVTWAHELDHAHAFHSIFEATQVHLTGALEHSLDLEPRIPTKDATAALKADEVEDFKKTAAEKIAAVVEDQARVMTALMEDHRRQRDSPEAYRNDAAKCPAADWDALFR